MTHGWCIGTFLCAIRQQLANLDHTVWRIDGTIRFLAVIIKRNTIEASM